MPRTRPTAAVLAYSAVEMFFGCPDAGAAVGNSWGAGRAEGTGALVPGALIGEVWFVGAAATTAAGWLEAVVEWTPKKLAQTMANAAKNDLNI